MAEDVLEVERCVEGAALWLLGEFKAALSTLQRDEDARASDVKAQHNKLVAQYYAAGAGEQEPQALVASLLQAARTDLVATADAESGSAEAAAAAAAGPAAYAVAAVNAAHILVLQARHASALELLEPLYARVESLNGGAALHVCLLLLEVHLAARQHTKAAAVIAYLELASGLSPDGHAARGGSGCVSADGGGGSEGGAAGGAAAEDGGAQAEGQQQADGGSEQAGGAAENSANGSGAAPSEAAASPPPADERAALRLPRVSRVTSPLMGRIAPLLVERGGAEGMPDARALLRLLRARLALSAGYHKAARRELKALLSSLPRCEAGLMLKAQLEAARGHPRKALRTLGPLLSAPPEDGGSGGGGGGDGGGGGALSRPAARVPLLNGLGLLHHQFGKHQLAAVYLSRALAESAAVPSGARAPGARAGGSGGGGGGGDGGAARFTGLWPDPSHAIHYNLGLQHLMLRNWGAALEAFEAAGQRFYMQPLLWLRMAEANVGLHSQSAAEAAAEAAGAGEAGEAAGGGEGASRHPLLSGVAGCGALRRLLLPAGRPAGEEADAERLWHEGPLGAALLQLQTAAALLQECKAEAAKEAEEAAAAATAAAASLDGGGGAAPNGRPGSSDGGGSPRAGRRRSSGGEGSPRGNSGGGAAGGGSSGGGGGGGGGARVLSDCLPQEQLEAIGQAVQSNLAYVHLLRDDPVPALAAAQQLLACSSLSAASHHLGSCYAAEALCMLGRPEEAAEQLRAHLALFHSAGGGGGAGGSGGGGPDSGGGPAAGAGVGLSLSTKSDDDGAGAREWYILGNAADAAAVSGPAARAAALSNLASALAAKGELRDAARTAQRALAAAAGAGPGAAGAAAAARLLLVYCRLRQGDAAGALALLRDEGGGGGGGGGAGGGGSSGAAGVV